MEEPKTFFQVSQEILSTKILNERKAILLVDVKKATVREALKGLTEFWKALKVEDLESREYEGILEGQKNFLTLSLIYQSLAEEDEVNEDTGDEGLEVLEDLEVEVEVDTQQEQAKEQTEEDTSIDTSLIEEAFERYCKFLEKDSMHETDTVKSITLSRLIKSQLILVSLILGALKPSESSFQGKFEGICAEAFSKEEIFASFYKILPKPFYYNLYMKYYQPFLQTFTMKISDMRLRNFMISSLEAFSKRFPEFPLRFEERQEIVMRRLGMESFNLEDCCDRIETRASVMALEAPIEMAQKMRDIWLLLEASKFLVFDDNCMTVYVFSAELPVFHEQIMRIFFVLNRLDETVREVGYISYCTPKFVSHFTTVYTEMHSWFVRLVQALSRNYEIYELESDKVTGRIRRKSEMTPFIAAKLKELSIFMTCPLASLDSTMRLSMEINNLPILFGDEEERFLFTTPIQNILVLHDFVANDRESFAKHTVELYPCLDRHFSRFHGSKKTYSQGPNLALPPSYHLFAKSAKPPKYEYYESNQEDLEAQMNDLVDVDEDCCGFCCKNILPGIIFVFALIGLFVLAYYYLINR